MLKIYQNSIHRSSDCFLNEGHFFSFVAIGLKFGLLLVD